MGFRHYLYVFDRKNLKNLKTVLQQYTDDEIRIFEADKILNATELLELGNYSEDGFALCKSPRKVSGYTKVIKQIHKLADNEETDFNILNREDLVWLIESYRNRTVTYWNQLLGKEPIPSWCDDAERAIEERCVRYVEDLLRWQKFLINTDEDRPWTLQSTWKYEYEMYNLLHMLKTINWKKQLLLIIGY